MYTQEAQAKIPIQQGHTQEVPIKRPSPHQKRDIQEVPVEIMEGFLLDNQEVIMVSSLVEDFLVVIAEVEDSLVVADFLVVIAEVEDSLVVEDFLAVIVEVEDSLVAEVSLAVEDFLAAIAEVEVLEEVVIEDAGSEQWQLTSMIF